MSIKIYIGIILLTLILCLQCKNKQKKVEISEDHSMLISSSYETNSLQSHGKLSPALFFTISIEISRIAGDIKNPGREDDTNKMLNNVDSTETEIRRIYKKYNITEDEFNAYSQNHYKELEQYLKEHPEIEKQLRNH